MSRRLKAFEQVPSMMALFEIAHRLKRARISFALGGSGLLHALGLCDVVQDWDITTDAPVELVEKLLTGLEFERVAASGIFATEYCYKIKLHGASIDLMGKFAFKQNEKSKSFVHDVSTVVTGYWRGIPLGSPSEWSEAYRLLGRQAKADLLSKYMKSRAMPIN